MCVWVGGCVLEVLGLLPPFQTLDFSIVSRGEQKKQPPLTPQRKVYNFVDVRNIQTCKELF